MKLIFRILLFTACIILGTASCGWTAELTSENLKDQAVTEYETLEKEYVKFEISENSTISISILKSFENLIKLIRSKYYSLLNWSAHTRRSDLQIENYDRKLQFGRWINDANDETCYNTRALVLIRDSEKDVIFKENNHCSVAAGHWNDPYTGQVFKTSEDIQIDHFIPLKNAYMSGAYKWNFKTRCLFANFLGSDYHLLSVNGTQNMKKGDRSPDKYIPPNSEYTCTYIKNWLSIKFLWGLRMTTSEAQAIATTIKNNHCSARSLYISDREIIRQSRFYQETIDLCERLDAANKANATPN